MHTHETGSLFQRHHRLLVSLSALYVVGLILSHSALPTMHVWAIAAFFSIAMNFTYLMEARSVSAFVGIETLVAIVLISMSIVGFFIAPVLVIAAIFGHGCWDLAKHRGAGVAFFTWYVLGCVVIDWSYSAVLLVYFLS